MRDLIASATQAMPTLMANEGNKIRRSQSQSVVSKPSQDLLGLTLHPIDTGETGAADEQNASRASQGRKPFGGVVCTMLPK